MGIEEFVEEVTVAPTVPIAPSSAPTPSNSRMIAYMGNWEECPTDEQLATYTHIVIAFAVSYVWAPSVNNCNSMCDIGTPYVCNNQVDTDTIKKWKDMGKKVIISFGGAGMGGSWDG